MSTKNVQRDEQIRLIMECRKSGLSYYQWCQRQGIRPGSFYNWVCKLRKNGYTFPESQSKSIGTEVVQDVVKVNLIRQELSSQILEQNACPQPLTENSCVADEFIVGNVTLRLFNGANQQVIQSTLQCLGGVSRAW